MRTIVSLLVLLAAAVPGCSPVHSPKAPAAAGVAAIMADEDQSRLRAIAAARAANPESGYRIGPDDMLEIRIPDLMDAGPAPVVGRSGPGDAVPSSAPVMQPGLVQPLRVTADGNVNIPMLGLVHAAGLTPPEFEADIRRRLIEGGLLRNPQVTVLVAEYRSRVVAVMGSVQKPGLYPVTRPGATLGDMLWSAGGPNQEAGRMAELVPAEEPESKDRPIRLDLEALLHKGNASDDVNIPARAGDVVNVPPAGNVQVDGWVDKPGSYPITRGLTVSGAVAAAGGALFAADRSNVVLSRNVGSGDPHMVSVDLEKVRRGEAPDLPVVGGDVVRLPADAARLGPWALWSVAKEVIHVGGSVLLF